MTKILMWSEETCDCPSSRALSALDDDDKFRDVMIKAEGGSFKAHRNILAAKIPYFRMMFNSNMAESSKGEITMHEVDSDSMGCLINFAYSGKLEIPHDKVVSLLRASTYLQIDFVTSICSEYLLNHLGPENAFELYAYAKDHNNSDMMEKAKHHFRTDFNEFSTSKDFVHLPFDEMRELISRDDLHIIREEEVFEAILSWLKESLDDRSVHFPELLRHIRMSLLSPRYLLQRIYDDRLIRKSPQCPFLLETVNKLIMSMDMLERNFPKPNERRCKEKQHLKCAYLMGRGLYSVSLGKYCYDIQQNWCADGFKINYYDNIRQEWVPLYENKSKIPNILRTFCTDEKIYFISDGWLSSFHFQTLAYSCSQIDIAPYDTSIALHDGKIYFFGGYEDDRILCLDFLLGNECVPAGQMLTSRTSASSTSLGENIYITGGMCANVFLKSAEKYNPITKQSTEIASMNTCRQYHSICVLNGKIYVCGGMTGAEMYEQGLYLLEDICITGEFYDPLINKWTFFLKNLNPRSTVTLAAYGDRLYAIDNIPEDSHFLVEIYDPFDKEWKSGEPIPSDKYICLCAVTTGSTSTMLSEDVLEVWETSDLEDKEDEDANAKEIEKVIEKSSGSGYETAEGMFNFACWTEKECSCEASRMFAVLKDMKDSDELCDVIIKIWGKCVKVHRNILAAREKDTKISFNSYITETAQRVVVLDDIDPASIECLINYVYTGKFEIPLSKVHSLLRAAIYLQIEYIFEYFLKRPDPSCAQEICTIAKEANSAYVFEKVKRYLTANFHEIWESRPFSVLPYLTLKEIISRDDLYVINEIEVFRAVLWWLKASLKDRSVHFPELLKEVRLSLTNHEYLVQCLNNDDFIGKSPQCCSLRNILRESLALITDKRVSKFSKPIERHFALKQHLKCAEITRQGLYCIIFTRYPGLTHVNYYDHFNRKWVRLFECKQPPERFRYSFCTEEKIYFITERRLSSFDLRTSEYSQDIFIFDYIPEFADVVLHKGKLYFFEDGDIYESTGHCFDSHLRCQKGKLVVQRSFSRSVSLGELIYITGGYIDNINRKFVSKERVFLRSAEKYNPITQESIDITEMHISRSHHSATVLNEKIYVYGGHNFGTFAETKHPICEFYDPLTDEWTILQMYFYPPWLSSLVTYDNTLYLPEYWSNTGGFTIRTYDPSEGKWKFGESLSFRNRDPCLYVFVTGSAFNSNDIYLLELVRKDKFKRLIFAGCPSEQEESSD